MTYVIGGDLPQAKTPKAIHDYDLENIEKKIKGAADKIRKLEFEKCNNKTVCKDCLQNSLCPERNRFGLKNKRP